MEDKKIENQTTHMKLPSIYQPKHPADMLLHTEKVQVTTTSAIKVSHGEHKSYDWVAWTAL